jgi:hypothetical protein
MAGNYKLLKEFLEQVFGPLPGWAGVGLGVAVIAWAALKFMPKLVRAFDDARKAVADRIIPLFYDRARRQAAEERRQFAGVLFQRLETLNAREDFSDEEFTELEAEVEVRGVGSRRDVWQWLFGQDRRPRQVESLSAVLRGCTSRIILLEGEPGSGKSTSVRHLALALARRAARARGLRAVLPVYVNLREFRAAVVDVTEADIRRHVRSVLLGTSTDDAANPKTKEFIDREFELNLRSGGWLFLFDSFDETPAVLRSPNFGPQVKNHGEAMERFLELSRCTGVVASRPYRAPNQFGWTHFQILPLSADRRADLVARSGLDRRRQHELLGWLAGDAAPGLVELSENPMFVRLLCGHWQAAWGPPASAFEVYDAYFTRRFRREVGKLEARGVTEKDAREAAELVAYCLSADRALGLSCAVDEIKLAVRKLVGRLPAHFDSRLTALMDARVLRPVGEAASRVVRFEHRRFQEYFATGYLLKRPEAVDPATLLTDATWREPAVVLLQRRVGDSVPRLLEAAEDILAKDRPPRLQTVPGGVTEAWPGASYHVLKLLAEGHALRSDDVPATLRTAVSEMIENAWKYGRHDEKHSAIELMSLMPWFGLGRWLTEVFGVIGPRGSSWFQETAVRQFPKLEIDAEPKRRYLQLVIGRAALDSRLRPLRYVIDRLVAAIPGHLPFHRLVALLSHQRTYYAAVFGVLWTSLILVLMASALYAPHDCLLTASAVTALLGLLVLVDRLALAQWVSQHSERPEDLKGRGERPDLAAGLAHVSTWAGLFLFALIESSPRRILAWFEIDAATFLGFAVFWAAMTPLIAFTWVVATVICNLVFLPADAMASLITDDVGVREYTHATPYGRVLLFALRRNPWRSRPKRKWPSWGWRHIPKILLDAALYLVVAIMMLLFIALMTAVGLDFIFAVFLIAVGMFVLYQLVFPLARFALIVWFRTAWLWTLPSSPGSLSAIQLLDLLRRCRLKSAGRTLLDRVRSTRCLDPTSDAIDLLTTLLDACDPGRTPAPAPEGVEFAQHVRTFAAGRRRWLVSLGPEFQDRLAQTLIQVKAFRSSESPT